MCVGARGPPPTAAAPRARPQRPRIDTRLHRAADRELWWRQNAFKANEITTEAQAEGAIEGSGDDYKVADFFGTDFKYRRFDALEAAPRSIAALSGTKRVVANAGANGAASWKRSKAGTSGDDAQAFEAERKQQP